MLGLDKFPAIAIPPAFSTHAIRKVSFFFRWFSVLGGNFLNNNNNNIRKVPFFFSWFSVLGGNFLNNNNNNSLGGSQFSVGTFLIIIIIIL